MMTAKQTKNEDKVNIRCPHCESTFDFNTVDKNNWGVEEDYIIIRCPLCSKIFKIVIKSKRETKR